MSDPAAQILVVDDNEATRNALARLLRAEGHVLLEAATGREALELARSARPDIILLDVHLPDMLGFEVAEVLRASETTRSIAILQISASFTGTAAQVQGLLRGADAYLTHPVEPQVLSATIHALLRMRRAEQLAQVERRRAEAMTAERDQLVLRLRAEAERKNDFLAVLSHELRNPLAPIRNSIHILGRSPPDSAQARRAREVIERQVGHMAHLIDDLLDVTRIARGKVLLQPERLALNRLVERSVEDHRDLLTRAGLSVEVALEAEPLEVDGDPTRLTQVIGNLLQNAGKFTPPGGRVSVSLVREGAGWAALRIRDDGAGITEETLARLFEPFVQGDRTLARSDGGLGLGLALTRGIVELHGGRITAHSEGPGRGSELVVHLPLYGAGA